MLSPRWEAAVRLFGVWARRSGSHESTGDSATVLRDVHHVPESHGAVEHVHSVVVPNSQSETSASHASRKLHHESPNAHSSSAVDVLISVRTFAARVEQLESGSPEEQAARAMLEQRGLTAAKMKEATDVLGAIATIQVADAVIPDPAAAEAAEKHMWAWYLEWSAIARTAIKDRRVLRSLGFLRSRPSGGPDEDVMDDQPLDDDLVEDLVPVPV
jgi:hypothetical protein